MTPSEFLDLVQAERKLDVEGGDAALRTIHSYIVAVCQRVAPAPIQLESIQQTWLAMFNSLGKQQYKSEYGWKGWVRTIAHRIVWDMAKTEYRQKFRDIDISTIERCSESTYGNDPVLTSRVNELMEYLYDHYRPLEIQALMMRVSGISGTTIADELDLKDRRRVSEMCRRILKELANVFVEGD